MLLIKVGQWIGALNTVGLVVLTGILGATMARFQGLSVLGKIQRELAIGQMPSESLFDGVLIFIGGILLLTPGILTDALGFFLLVPYGRLLVKNYLKRKIRESFDHGRTIHIRYFNHPNDF